MGKALVLTTADFSSIKKGTITLLQPVIPTALQIVGDKFGRVGDIIPLKVNFVPYNTSFRQIEWSTNNNNASISQDGNLLLLSEGNVIVTAKSVAVPSISATLEVSIASVETVIITTNVNCVKGWVDATNGSFEDDAVLRTGRLDLTPFSRIKVKVMITNVSANKAGYAFYDAASPFGYITGEHFSGPSGEIEITLEPDSAYLFATSVRNTPTQFEGLLKTDIPYKRKLDIPTLTKDYYIGGNSGNVFPIKSGSSIAGVGASDFIEVLPGMNKIYVPLPSYIDDEVCGMAFYDDGKQKISTYSEKIPNVSSYYSKFKEIDVPSNAKYMRFTLAYYGFNFILY